MLHGRRGEVEFVVEELTGDAEMDWYIEEFGGGVMVKEPEMFGHCFLHNADDSDWEHLEFVSGA